MVNRLAVVVHKFCLLVRRSEPEAQASDLSGSEMDEPDVLAKQARERELAIADVCRALLGTEVGNFARSAALEVMASATPQEVRGYLDILVMWLYFVILGFSVQ